MITLTPITDAGKLDEYFRFRFRIYSESRQAGFVNDTEDRLDVDRYDTFARHYGWYVNGELAGCVRFVEPDWTDEALPMLSYLCDHAPKRAVEQFIIQCSKRGVPMVEAGRFCLAPEHRGLRTAKEFVLAMVRTMQPLGFEHGLFDCDVKHGSFYSMLGFDTLEAAGTFKLKGLHYTACMKQYGFAKVLAKNPDVINKDMPMAA